MLAGPILVAASIAGVPSDVHLRPVAATPAILARFERWQAERGGPSSPPHCQPLTIPEVQLCFRVWEGAARRWVTEADRRQWNATPEELQDRVRRDCVESVGRAELRTVSGGRQRYLALTDGDGWAVAGILCPHALAERLRALAPTAGVSFRAALPTQDVLLAWAAGDAELDRIMAVAAREIHDLQPRALTPGVVHHDGERWRTFGRAVPVR